MGNALNRQRYLMAQGYTYKVLVNITKGLKKEASEAKGMKTLLDEEKMKEMLRQVRMGRAVERRRWRPTRSTSTTRSGRT